MKIAIEPKFDKKNLKIELISQTFSPSLSFLPRLAKNGLKNESKIFFSDFHENFHIT